MKNVQESMSMNDDTTPAERIIGIIERELPGFSGKIDAHRDEIHVSGPIYLSGFATRTPTVYPVADSDDFIEHMARDVIENTRRHGIHQLGLEAVIAEREDRARRQGRAEGYVEGYREGKAAGV